jgi:Holliday junction resolvase RusA-like endonuclease
VSLEITVPGEPCAQGRPRAFRTKAGFIRTFDPEKSRSWKGVAQVHYTEALRQAGLASPAFDGAVEVQVLAVFTCPKSQHRKREPLPRRRRTGRPDPDNIGKAVMDAANGVLFVDDSQVVRLVVEKWTGAQGEAPHVLVTVRSIPE